MQIDDKDITFLVHGPDINNITNKCISKISQIFPSSPIIFSTWDDSSIKKYPNCLTIINKDPGAEFYNCPKNSYICMSDERKREYILHNKHFIVYPKYNNINRMLTTIKSAISLVKTPYVCKIRSDLILKNKHFLAYWDKYSVRDKSYSIFEHRILNNNLYAQYAHVMDEGIQFLPFHISDWFMFGFTQDVEKLFSCKYLSLEDASHYWEKHKRKNFDPFEDALWRYPPEEYIFYSIIKEYHPNIKFSDSDDYNAINMQQSNKFIINNFVMLDSDQIKFKLSKYPNEFNYDECIYRGLITHREWQWLYRTYCDASYKFFSLDYKRIMAALRIACISPLKSFKWLKGCFSKNILHRYFKETLLFDEVSHE